MNPSDLAILLLQSESGTLDFKRKYPPFSGATDEQKSELLKDLLAMANACKNAGGYILIGVEEENGRAKKVLGAETDIKDSDLQQFVKSKTNRPVSFRVEVIPYDGVNVTAIQIDQAQHRPIFLTSDFGKLRRNILYIRRGSSTDQASPDEITALGRDESLAQQVRKRTDLFWREFKSFLPHLENKATFLLSNYGDHAFDAIVTARLPISEANSLLQQARESELDGEFRGQLAELVGEIRVIDEYINLGVKLNDGYLPNFRHRVQIVQEFTRKMRQQYLQ